MELSGWLYTLAAAFFPGEGPLVLVEKGAVLVPEPNRVL